MPRHLLSPSLIPLCLAGLLLASASQAQTPAAAPNEAANQAEAASPATSTTTRSYNENGMTTTTVIRDGRRIEQITVEDAGSRVDELREGGETRKITVQPKNNAPAYDVRPPDSGAGSRGRDGGSGNAGERSWKLIQF